MVPLLQEARIGTVASARACGGTSEGNAAGCAILCAHKAVPLYPRCRLTWRAPARAHFLLEAATASGARDRMCSRARCWLLWAGTVAACAAASSVSLPADVHAWSQEVFSNLFCTEHTAFTSSGLVIANTLQLRRMPPAHTLQNMWPRFSAALDAYLSSAWAQLATPHAWPLDDAAHVQARVAALAKGQQLMPFVARVLVPPASKVAVFGDLHGTVHSLVRHVRRLVTAGYLTPHLRVAPAHATTFYMVFCGDYVDRGYNGVEVMALLLQLRTLNPSNVFLVRGNHEDVHMHDPNSDGSFLHELRSKFPQASRDELMHVFNVYETLPQALFLGVATPDANTQRPSYVLCAHGGVELGYDPLPFLSSDLPSNSAAPNVTNKTAAGMQTGEQAQPMVGAQVRYAIVHALRRRDWLLAQPADVRNQLPRSVLSVLHNYGSTAAYGMDETHADVRVQDSEADRVHAYPVHPTHSEPTNGFMWWDFYVSNTRALLGYNPHRGMILGKRVTRDWLQRAGIVAVFRAHQHNDSPEPGPMLTRVREAGGIFDNWNASGLVLTHLSGAWIPHLSYPFDSHGLLTLPSHAAASWSMEKCSHEPALPHARLGTSTGQWWQDRAPPQELTPTVPAVCSLELVSGECAHMPWHSELLDVVAPASMEAGTAAARARVAVDTAAGVLVSDLDGEHPTQ